MEKAITCCFTGHRPDKLPWGDYEQDARCVALKAQLAEALEAAYDAGFRHFVGGMACGCDLYFCEAVFALRAKKAEVTMEAAVPCQEQADRWSEADRRRYRALLDGCDIETVVQHHYSAGCMQRRNCYMVDHAARMIAVYDGTPGGTMNTLLYAMREGVEVICIDLE